MKSQLNRVLQTLLGPALRWMSAQLGQIQTGIDALAAGQDSLRASQGELADVQRAVLARRDAEIEVVGRTLSVQREALAAMEAEQRRLADEVRALRAALELGGPLAEVTLDESDALRS